MIYEVLNVFKTFPPQTDPATIQGHTNKVTDRWDYPKGYEIRCFRRKRHIMVCPFVPNYKSES